MRSEPWSVFLFVVLLLVSGCEKDECPAEDVPSDMISRSYRDTLLSGLSHLYQLPCNGHPQLCDRRLDEVFFAMTHNSHAHSGAYSAFAANQNGDVTAQLEAGVRGLNIKPYWTSDASCGDGSQGLYLYHGFASLGCEPFADYLFALRNFLVANPFECVVMTIEGSASTARMDSIFNHTGLRPYMLSYNGSQWPTLREMIASGKRLLVLADRSNAESYDGFHRMWNHVVDVNYSHTSPATFDCDFDRGNPDGSFFLLNNFITNITPQPNSAAQVNAFSLIYPRALSCWQANGKRPNFIMVDFYATGDVLQVVDSLNLLH